MGTEERTIISKTPVWVSSWHCRNEIGNCVGVKEKIIIEYSDGTTEYKDNLHFYEDPQRPFWITKPQFQNHAYKKEFEDLDKCEPFICRDSELESALENALGLPPTFRKRSLRQLCSSPYVYGADIDTMTLIKQNYMNKTPPGKIPQYTRGGLDIETEVRGEKKINLITFIHENVIYTAALREYCKYELPDKTFAPANEGDCLKVVDAMLGKYLKENGFTLEFAILDTEIEMIEWIFSHIHKHKTDYIGVWNLGFDIPKIIQRIEALGEDPASIMSHPDVPRRFRFCDWYEDKGKNSDHFTDKWHWLSIPGYSQFLDSMCLYARLRKVTGRESSYALDEIANKELGTGKLHFGTITNHWYMQNYRFLEYIAYNINDVVIMQLMEKKNNDMTALSGLTGMSLLSQFARQTVMVRNDAYNYGKAWGKVPASSGASMFTEYDLMQGKSGGTVLPPDKAVNVGVSVLEEFDYPSQVSLLSNDLDVSSMYPSITSAFNISKETTLATAISINGFPQTDVELYFGGINQPHINAVPICEHFYGFPGYKEMAYLFRSQKENKAA